jgi:hypothetical protein
LGGYETAAYINGAVFYDGLCGYGGSKCVVPEFFAACRFQRKETMLCVLLEKNEGPFHPK